MLAIEAVLILVSAKIRPGSPGLEHTNQKCSFELLYWQMLYESLLKGTYEKFPEVKFSRIQV